VQRNVSCAFAGRPVVPLFRPAPFLVRLYSALLQGQRTAQRCGWAKGCHVCFCDADLKGYTLRADMQANRLSKNFPIPPGQLAGPGPLFSGANKWEGHPFHLSHGEPRPVWQHCQIRILLCGAESEPDSIAMPWPRSAAAWLGRAWCSSGGHQRVPSFVSTRKSAKIVRPRALLGPHCACTSANCYADRVRVGSEYSPAFVAVLDASTGHS
jgi:hypothetical protein